VYRVRDRDDQELQARRLGRSEIARATSRVRSNVVWPCDPVRRVRDFSGAHFRPISDTIFLVRRRRRLIVGGPVPASGWSVRPATGVKSKIRDRQGPGRFSG
jgi:hypothetical protein